MKEKMKASVYERAYDIERGGQGSGGREGGGGLYSCTLNHAHTGTDYPFHTYIHTHSTGELKHIKRLWGQQKAE